ncbi:hypothetical protein HDU81_001498, partial [Chytriomyces hyalinus]
TLKVNNLSFNDFNTEQTGLVTTAEQAARDSHKAMLMALAALQAATTVDNDDLAAPADAAALQQLHTADLEATMAYN